MIFDNYLSSTYLDIFYNNYYIEYLEMIDENNFVRIYNLLKEKGFNYIEDIILNYLEIFELSEREVLDSLNKLKDKYGDNYTNIISNDMTILDEILREDF